MKKLISIILILTLFTYLCGCEKSKTNHSSQPSDTGNQIEKPESSLPEVTHPLGDGSNDKNNQSTNGTSSTGPTICPPYPNNSTSDSSNETTASKSETLVTKSNLPNVVYSVGDDVVYKDILPLKNGDFAAVGVKYTYDPNLSVLRICDSNGKIKKEHLFSDGNGYDKIASCTDGGYIAASYNPPYLTKISSDFRVEWVKEYYNVACEGIVQDVAQIGVEYAVLFAGTPYPTTQLKIAFLNRNGELTKTIDLMKNTDISDGDIIPDSNDGFYLVLTCNENLADKFDVVKNEYDNLKATEVIIMHFNKDKQLTFAKTIGGGGNDWVEESTTDDEGNFYVAIGTDWLQADDFWDMSVEAYAPFRRMLVKLDKNGNLVYKLPLSNKGMAVDQVFGIHIKEQKTYVVGMADYFDGYQSKYPCEQISKDEKGDRVFSVYTVCVDKNGKELNRNIFRCDINNTPCDSAMLSNGNLVIAGQVSSYENPFKLDLPYDFNRAAAFYIYK
ncbi:MAG: hypothetical protein IKV81_02755 [Clostridia bacterium]|nr:hypothetical protein [Clostridia bacterium]